MKADMENRQMWIQQGIDIKLFSTWNQNRKCWKIKARGRIGFEREQLTFLDVNILIMIWKKLFWQWDWQKRQECGEIQQHCMVFPTLDLYSKIIGCKLKVLFIDYLLEKQFEIARTTLENKYIVNSKYAYLSRI